ncbi:MAG: hypothetical protein RR384_08115 [Acidaminococcaceae bacterium]
MEREKSQPIPPVAMAGLILLMFERNKYCANQISAVLEMVTKAFEKHRNLEPIEFDTVLGKHSTIKAFEEFIIKDAIEKITSR